MHYDSYNRMINVSFALLHKANIFACQMRKPETAWMKQNSAVHTLFIMCGLVQRIKFTWTHGTQLEKQLAWEFYFFSMSDKKTLYNSQFYFCSALAYVYRSIQRDVLSVCM